MVESAQKVFGQEKSAAGLVVEEMESAAGEWEKSGWAESAVGGWGESVAGGGAGNAAAAVENSAGSCQMGNSGLLLQKENKTKVKKSRIRLDMQAFFFFQNWTHHLFHCRESPHEKVLCSFWCLEFVQESHDHRNRSSKSTE